MLDCDLFMSNKQFPVWNKLPSKLHSGKNESSNYYKKISNQCVSFNETSLCLEKEILPMLGLLFGFANLQLCIL